MKVRIGERDRVRVAGLSLAACAVALAAQPASAFKFDIGDGFSGSLDSTVSFGMAMRMANQSCALIGRDNGGCASLTAPLPEASQDAFALNADDGDLNYWNHRVYSTVYKGTHELYLKAPWDLSAFFRVTEQFDPRIQKTERTQLNGEALRYAMYNVTPLDAYLNWNFDWLDRSGRIRIGNQIVSWGEDFFVLGGINYINSYDVRRSHVPGTQVKEILRPSPMVSLNTDLVHNLSLESYYQLHWKSYMIDPVGTYFSTVDAVGKGNNGAIFIPTSSLNAGLATNSLAQTLIKLNLIRLMPYGTLGDLGTGLSAAQLEDPTYVTPRIIQGLTTSNPFSPLVANIVVQSNPALQTGNAFPLVSDAGGSNKGNYGAALRYHADWADGDFGLYYEHYNEKIPFVSYTVEPTNSALQKANPFSAGYEIEYPSNRELFGLSFSTNLGNWALGTELSYRPNQAVGIDPSVQADDTTNPSNKPYACVQGGGEAFGKYCKGWVDQKDYQFDFSALQVLTPNDGIGAWILPFMAASEGTFIFETGATYYPSISPLGGTPWSLPGYTLPSKISTGAVTELAITYPNIFGTGVNWSPQIDYSQGLAGNSPNAIPWQSQVKAGTLTSNFNYQNAITAGFAYTCYWGGGPKNLLSDRDFLTFNIAYNF